MTEKKISHNRLQADLNKEVYESYQGKFTWREYFDILNSLGKEAAKEILKGNIIIFPYIGHLFICKKKPDPRFRKVDFTKSVMEWCKKTQKRKLIKTVFYDVPEFVYTFYFKKYAYTGINFKYIFKPNQRFLKRSLVELITKNKENLPSFLEADEDKNNPFPSTHYIARLSREGMLEKTYEQDFEIEADYTKDEIHRAIRNNKPYKNKLWRLINR